ncbi:ABC transporter permease [Streptomyces sp. NPDC001714]|uniref:ABC transporter permease n=1 Tax=Streptomyces sp. NPDC001714 TaxID=3364603 RepID=UPI00368A8490
MTATTVAPTAAASPARTGRLRGLRPGLALCWLVLALVAVATLWPHLLAPGDPDATHVTEALRGPGGGHLFGTDQLGRDVYTRVVHGARISVEVGVGSTLLALGLGTVVGGLASLGGRWADEALMRLTDVLLAFPGTLLALLVVAMLGPGTGHSLIAIGLSAAPGFARLVRGQALAIRDADYVRTTVTFGCGRPAAYLRHLLPNALPPLLVLATINVGVSIIAGASLSFLGLGPAAPTPEWGAMLAQGEPFLAVSWAVAVFPGLAVTATVVAVNVVGRDLQRRLAGRDLHARP